MVGTELTQAGVVWRCLPLAYGNDLGQEDSGRIDSRCNAVTSLLSGVFRGADTQNAHSNTLYSVHLSCFEILVGIPAQALSHK